MDWLEELRERETLDEVREECDRTVRKIRSLYMGCKRRERDLINEINWLQAELHGAELKAERTCHTIPYNSQAEEYADAWKISAVCSECGWTLETKKGDKVRMHDPYCGGCGAKVVG